VSETPPLSNAFESASSLDPSTSERHLLDDSVEMPAVGDAFQRVLAGILEDEA